MKKIIIVNMGSLCDNIITTSIITGLKKQYPESVLSWVSKNDLAIELFKYNKDCIFGVPANNLLLSEYDELINLSPSFNPFQFPNLKFKKGTGFGFNKNSLKFQNILFGCQKTKLNIFQVYFGLCDLIWHGEGYNIAYFPKTKSHSNRTGIALSNSNLRNFISENLELETKRLWYVPFKKNPLKKMDEINRCKEIITDDLTTLHLSIALRKDVYFLKTTDLNYKIEFFGKGKVFSIPKSLIQYSG